MTTVGELKSLIKDLPDDMKVVLPGSDHSYNLACFGVTKAEVLYTRKRVTYMLEYYGDRHRSEVSSKIEDVLSFSSG